MNWIMIKFEDGSNPYICKTEEEFRRMQKKYPNMKKLSDDVYRVGDTYAEKIETCVAECDSAIIKVFDEYDTRDLEEIVCGLVKNHLYTTADSVQGLIYELEKIKEVL